MPGPGTLLLTFLVVVATLAGLFAARDRITRKLGRYSARVRREDAIKHIYMCQLDGRSCSLESLAGRLEVPRGRAAGVLSELADMGLLHLDATGLLLTSQGERVALRLVRTHRMWERYLADRTGLPASEWHDEADRVEHTLSVAEVDILDARLGHPSWDPHGDPIPTADGYIPPDTGISLIAVELGRTVEIVHLEDEPREIYDGLLRDGFLLGGRLDVVGRSDQCLRVRLLGREFELTPVAAANVTVRYLPVGEYAETNQLVLSDVRDGETVVVQSISQACGGVQRRRLLDLGVVRGTEVTRELTSAGGDPTGYRIRGALIALRNAQAEYIVVDRVGSNVTEERV